MKARIAITTTLKNSTDGSPREYTVQQSYVDAIRFAGGYPVLLPCTDDVDENVVSFFDGLLIPGGVDVDPLHYDEEPDLLLGEVDPLRDHFELSICRLFLELNKPIIGICRGMQLLNVAAGGTLYQDIHGQTGSRLQHRQKAPMHYAMHEVSVAQESRLRRIVWRENLRVNTYHHQAVHRPAAGFKVSATAPDGIIEAIEREGEPLILGVQWHPERMPDQPPSKALFDAFIASATQLVKDQ